MFIPGSIPTNTNLPLPTMNHHHLLHQQQQFLFDNLKDHRSNKFSLPMSRKTSSSTPNFSLDPDLLRELNARYLHDINTTRSSPSSGNNSNLDGNPGFLLPPFLRAEHYHQHTHTHEHNLNILTPTNNSLLNGNSLLEKLSKSDNSLSSFLRTTTTTTNANNISLPPPPPPSVPPIFPSINSGTTTPTTTNSSKETSSPPAKKCGKWCAAHVRISWMIYHHQQQRSKEKLSPSDNKKEEELSQSSLNSKLMDLSSNTKPILPPTNDLSLPLPSTFSNPLLPPPTFSYRSPFDFGVVNNGPFGRVPPSSTTAFGGLGSLFPPPPPPPPPSSIDRKSDMNGSAAAAAAALGLDWSRFHRGIGPPSLIPPSHPLSNENFSAKKLDETANSNNEKKRSSSVLNNDDDRRHSHHHLMPPPSHLTSNNNHSSNRSRSRSPHPSLHHHHHHHSSSTLINKNSSSPPLSHSSSRKRNSPNIKSETSKPSLHPPPSNLGAFDPLTLSMIERQRLTAAYASLFAGVSQANNFFPGNVDPSTFRNHTNSSSTLFPTLDPSAMTTALMQREHFLNSLRQQQELIEHERATHNSLTKSASKPSIMKSEQISPKTSIEETPRISPKVTASPGSHSSTSSSSSSSKKIKHVKREHPSPSPSNPSTNENLDIKPKEES